MIFIFVTVVCPVRTQLLVLKRMLDCFIDGSLAYLESLSRLGALKKDPVRAAAVTSTQKQNPSVQDMYQVQHLRQLQRDAILS